MTAPNPALADYYVWDDRESGIAVCLEPQAVDRLQMHVLGPVKPASGPRAETGGILLGRTESAGGKRVVKVEDFQPVAIEHQRGPAYALSRRDLLNFEAALAHCRSAAKRPLKVVGYYRAHNREGLRLSTDDLALIKAYFPGPESVFLLVKTLPTRACTAGLFFPREGALQSEFPCLEVPLGPIHSIGEAPKEPEKAPVPIAQPVVTAAPQQARARVMALPMRHLVATVAALAAIAGITLYQFRPAPRARVQAASTQASFGLNAAQTDKGFAITWDRRNPEIAAAQGALLRVRDGSAEKSIVLDANQLRAGSLSYTPVAGDLDFRLQLNRSGQPAGSESLHVIVTSGVTSGAPRIVAARATDAAPKSVAPSKPAQAPVQHAPAEAPRPTFSLPPIVATNLPAEPVLTPPSENIETAGPTGAGKMAGLMEVSPAAVAPPVRAPEKKPDAAPLRVASAAVGPEVIYRAPVTLTPMESSMLAPQVEIDVLVSIDANGAVTGAHVNAARGGAAALLTNKTLEAAKLFRFRPARQNNHNVQSSMVLTFRFVRPNRY